MIGLMVYGEKYIGWPVSDGIKKDIHCNKCGKITSFSEMKGRKFFHIYYVPLVPISGKKKWLECDFCDSVLLDYEQKIKDHEENTKREKDFEEIKKEMQSYLEEMEYIHVKCPSCRKDGKVRLPEGHFSADAICQICGNIYKVEKPK